VTLLLDDDVDISRGDLICRPNNRPAVAQDIEGMVCWMTADRPLTPRTRLVVKHTTRTVKGIVTDLHYRIDVNTLHRDENATSLGLNEIGRVRLRLTQPVFADPYARNRLTGGMILIDEATNTTVGTVMITEPRLSPGGTLLARGDAPRTPQLRLRPSVAGCQA
jgi:sulfate adenylyltransferase subunit 1 (EFTu-like GTPase family)